MEQAQELINGIQKGLLQWYDFKKGSTVLYIGEKDTPLAQMLLEGELKVKCTALEVLKNGLPHECDGHFDYIICIEALERQVNPVFFMTLFYKLLKQDGIMLLGMNNRMGIRYFCGDRDIYTNRCFDGIF